jgi:hypothetical protein
MVRVTALPVSVNMYALASGIGATSAATVNAATAILIFKVSSMRVNWAVGKCILFRGERMREDNLQALWVLGDNGEQSSNF